MACIPYRPSKEVLQDWEPCLVEFDEPMFGKRTVPGWRCKHCGALFGCVEPPSRCWKCPPKTEQTACVSALVSPQKPEECSHFGNPDVPPQACFCQAPNRKCVLLNACVEAAGGLPAIRFSRLKGKIPRRTPESFGAPFFVVALLNRYCKAIPVKSCPCAVSWLCDGLHPGRAKMSSPYDAASEALRIENFGEEVS